MNNRWNALLASLCLLVVLGLIFWFGPRDIDNTTLGDKVMVVTTIYPLADFVTNIGGDLVEVINIVPAGVEPHEYEPSSGDVIQVLEADVLVYLGGGIDAWAHDLANDIIDHGGQALALHEAVSVFENDPHVWLDPVLVQELVAVILVSLIETDPEHAKVYTANAKAYLQTLQQLNDEYVAALSNCQLDDIIVSHDAFGYLARRYAFNVKSIVGFSPEAEPSVRDLATLIDVARVLKVRTIFFETLVSPELAQTLAQELGVTTSILNPLEGLTADELAAGENYVSIMRSNKAALMQAMLCQ